MHPARRWPGTTPIHGHTGTQAPGHNPDPRAHGHTAQANRRQPSNKFGITYLNIFIVSTSWMSPYKESTVCTTGAFIQYRWHWNMLEQIHSTTRNQRGPDTRPRPMGFRQIFLWKIISDYSFPSRKPKSKQKRRGDALEQIKIWVT